MKSILQKADLRTPRHFTLRAKRCTKAQYEIALEYEGHDSINYFCVGYSVLSYQLDGEEIGSLVDQSGYVAAVEVIATFLPKVVVDSLLAALNRAGLELEALTLEPIAAINVLIPPTMRRLNVALVDIGAGTSDIAITDSGTITAYGMVPVAGDEITEAISDHFLLDFPEAEIVKRQLYTNDEVVIKDILGFETVYKSQEVIELILPAIENLAKSITTEILNLNKKPPKAVMLVGGGSMTPNLAKVLAKCLQLPENRVAIRGIDAIKSLKLTENVKAGPELVTPIGIAIAAKESPVEYLSVKVNDQTIRLFDIKQLTVGDGLLAAGIEISKLYGKPGLAIMVKVNNRLITIPGEHGKAPRLEKNGQSCSLDMPVRNGDTIFVQIGADGKNAEAIVGDVFDSLPSKTIIINGRNYSLPASVIKNGKKVHYQIQF
ncbi:cell division FtsA domain-containing protein [Anaerobacillus sp. CMMVII]|uniref:cell division FtsA domain-containing protein n=1 Tax=Anaerobacillus sp. CMMVII TaxID=2755588 RepID=UPI0028E0A036|nr:cell division FtsA domain-containing protein [Anaerobacillus sp. CMMVII]